MMSTDNESPRILRVAETTSTNSLLRELVIIYPDAEICGHRDLYPDKDCDGVVEPHEWIKMCPCFDAKKEYRMI